MTFFTQMTAAYMLFVSKMKNLILKRHNRLIQILLLPKDRELSKATEDGLEPHRTPRLSRYGRSKWRFRHGRSPPCYLLVENS
jgi:hypothetical protein